MINNQLQGNLLLFTGRFTIYLKTITMIYNHLQLIKIKYN